MKKNFILPAVLILVISVINFSCGKSAGYTTGGGGGPTGFATDSINLSGLRYSPAIDTVHVGAVVKWKNNDGVNHTVNTDDGTTIISGNITPTSVFTFTFTTAGTYSYHCIYHGSMGMVGTLYVKP
jgi:plastocyanin